jgi:hypothetical protein
MPIERNHTVSTRRPFFGVILAVNRQATLARSLRDKDALWAPVSVLLGRDELLLIRVLPPDMIVSKPDERELIPTDIDRIAPRWRRTISILSSAQHERTRRSAPPFRPDRHFPKGL